MLQWWEALFLGAVQGLTEFLPISSSGHLLLFRSVLGLREVPLTFDIVIHLGTLVAVFVYFHKQILAASWKYWLHVGIATVPAVIIGLGAKDAIESTAFNGAVLGMGFLITSFFMFLAQALLLQEKSHAAREPWEKIVSDVQRFVSRYFPQDMVKTPSIWQSICIGCMQAVALLPSVSRSGSTLLGALLVGMSRKEAFEFIFLMSVPAILGANILDLFDVYKSGEYVNIPWGLYGLGTLVSMLTGLASLVLLQKVMRSSRLHWFAFYTLIVGILSFLFV